MKFQNLKFFTKIHPLTLSLCVTLLFTGLTVLYVIDPKFSAAIALLVEKSLDLKFQFRGFEKPKHKIVIVAGDEKAFQTFGQWPFDRGAIFAPLVNKLCQLNPKVIGFDIVWTDREKLIAPAIHNGLTGLFQANSKLNHSFESLLANESGDTKLAAALSHCKDKIVLGYALSNEVDQSIDPKDLSTRFQRLLESSSSNEIKSSTVGQGYRISQFRGDPDSNLSFFHTASSGQLNISNLTTFVPAQGFFNNDADDDGNFRRASLFFNVNKIHFVSSLALRMAQKVRSPIDKPPTLTLYPDQLDEMRLELFTQTGSERVSIDPYGHAIVRYRGPNQTFINVSMADFFSNDPTVEYKIVEPTGRVTTQRTHKADLIKDALVLVGITATGLYDIRPRPLDAAASGVENHANILDNLLSNDLLVRPTPDWLLALTVVLLANGLLFGWAVAHLGGRSGALFATASLIFLTTIDQIWIFEKHNIFFPSIIPLLQILLQYLLLTVLKFIREESEKQFIRSAFDKYVSPKVINAMLKDKKKLTLGGEKKSLSVLFSDIRDFTKLSERIEVKDLTQFLNEYLGTMTDTLQNNQGTLDKYIGDAIMAFWNAPLEVQNHPALAVKTAVEMSAALNKINLRFQEKYGFTIEIGIGINSGQVSVGNFGSSKVFQYTVIGDDVNLASRIEGLTKYYGVQILISETTYRHLPEGQFLCREIDRVRVKGRSTPVKIYQVYADTTHRDTLQVQLTAYSNGLAAYYRSAWVEAVAFLNSFLQSNPNDGPAREILHRCAEFEKNPPPPGWDGSWEMQSK